MKNIFPEGVWPVMLTPFTEDNKVDYIALEKLINWYIENGAAGLFAVCQSSEMFQLTLDERKKISRFVKQCAGKTPVISSGHISDSFEDQIRELNEISETGIDALILITNRLAGEEENDDILLGNLDKLIARLPNIPLGFYECPYPYKRIISPKVAKYCADQGSFHFIKDTSCDIGSIEDKLRITKGSEVKLYNANTATLLASLKLGAAGYSGVMANFHPMLYKWLVDNYEKFPDKAEKLQRVLTMCSLIELRNYPVNAKYMMQLCNNGFTLQTRKLDCATLDYLHKEEVNQLIALSEDLLQCIFK